MLKLQLETLDELRVFELDGAVLGFDRRTGLTIVRRAKETETFRQRAPRFVQFGITNACNLACGYCSRDERLETRWNPESAFDLLAGLARAGVMEVAFGGGEPLAARGFDELVKRLHEETPLGIGVTTNGTLLDDGRIARLLPYVSQFRISVHEDNAAHATVERLARHGASFGLNLLVTPQSLSRLETDVLSFASLGCEDFLLLGYTGDDRSLHLSESEESELERRIVVLMQALRGRARFSIDVCFGDRLDVPRLVEHADCAAGRDGVVVSVDGRVQSCSFQAEGVPFVDAADVIRIWRDERARLAAPSPRGGCARRPDHGLGRARKHRPRPSPVRGWLAYRAFASNNSGSYTLLGRFESAELAASAAERLSRLFEEQHDWNARHQGSKPLAETPPFETFVKEEGLRSGSELIGDDWPELWSSAPVAGSFGQDLLIHCDYTVGLPRALGEFIYVRGGSVSVKLGHAHHPVILSATFYPAKGPWNQNAAVLAALRPQLGAELPGAKLVGTADFGTMVVWLAGADPLTLARAARDFATRHELRCWLHIEEGATGEDPLRDRRAGAEPV